MAKFLVRGVRGEGKFLEAALVEIERATDGYPLIRPVPTGTSIEAQDLVHFGTDNMKFDIHNTLSWRDMYERILDKADKVGADYVFMSHPKNDSFVSRCTYETILTMYLKKR